MKTNNSRIDGGHLKREYYDEFAQYIIDIQKQYEEKGLELYCIGPQNESGETRPYNSCVYDPEEYRDMIKTVGEKNLFSPYNNGSI